MNRPTLSTFRQQWPAEAMGICQADPLVAQYCNEAQERLLMDPMAPEEGWWGGWVSMTMSVTVSGSDVYVTVPREIGRLTDMAVCKDPIHIRNGFYEYLKYGSGLKPKTCQGTTCGTTMQAYERDNVVTLSPLLSTPQKIRIYPTDTKDAGFRVLIAGKDQNNQTILTTDPGTGQTALGEYIQLAFPFVDSLNQFALVNAIQKDQTYGPIQMFQVDPTTGVESALSAMDPNEFQASYRRYFIGGISTTNLCCTGGASTAQIQAQGRFDFIPVINETDYLIIPNVPALVEEAMSIRYGRMDSGNSSEQRMIHHAAALALLNGQLDAYVGKTNTAVRMPLFGSNRMTRQPV